MYLLTCYWLDPSGGAPRVHSDVYRRKADADDAGRAFMQTLGPATHRGFEIIRADVIEPVHVADPLACAHDWKDVVADPAQYGSRMCVRCGDC